MVVSYKEGPGKEPPYDRRSGRFLNEPTVEKISEIRIRSSRTMYLFRSVPPALPKVF